MTPSPTIFSDVVAKFLVEHGYKEFKSQNESSRIFQKMVDAPGNTPPCECNDHLYFTVKVWEVSFLGADQPHYRNIEIDFVALGKDRMWVEFKVHSSSDDVFFKRLEFWEKRFVQMWTISQNE